MMAESHRFDEKLPSSCPAKDLVGYSSTRAPLQPFYQDFQFQFSKNYGGRAKLSLELEIPLALAA